MKEVNLYKKIRYKIGRARRPLFPPSNILKSIKAAQDPDSIIVRWPNRSGAKDNWGDKLNLPLVEKISKKRVFNFNDVYNIKDRPAYSVIGSSLGAISDKELIVWGTGFIHYDKEPINPPKKICAVRGPLSRAKYLDQGIDCPDVYGDPGLLCPKYWSFENIDKKYKVGIIPQWRDKGLPIIEQYRESSEIKIIDIYGSIEGVIKDILSCENIMSTSLHGLIASDAYEVPSLWLRLSENPMGDLFKFQDYYESIGIKGAEPAIASEDFDINKLVQECVVHDLNINLDQLLAACPFKSKN